MPAAPLDHVLSEGASYLTEETFFSTALMNCVSPKVSACSVVERSSSAALMECALS